MQNEPLVLCDETLVGINGGDIVTDAQAFTNAIQSIGNGLISLAEDIPGWIMQGLSAHNAALGPTGGSYNPYSNPINCEYAGYY